MTLVAGVDEVGRGPLAGPVVAAAVILDPTAPIEGLADSKAIPAGERARLAALIRARALAVGVGVADAAEIDALNILQATFLAMRRAVLALAVVPTRLEVDGNRLPPVTGLGFSVSCECFIKGDARIPAISAASIVAKVWRDGWMERAAAVYPGYGFEEHKGYGTRAHRRALDTLGPCVLHRHSFEPLRSRR